jgi:hypothetical protein
MSPFADLRLSQTADLLRYIKFAYLTCEYEVDPIPIPYFSLLWTKN